MSWFPAVDSTLIHDFEVGLSSTSNGIAPDIFPFRSSKHHSHFRLNHPDVPDGREFYVVIESIGKSGIDGLQVVNIAYCIIIECLTLLTCGKHLHYRIISLRGEVWVQKIVLIPPLYIEMPVPNQLFGTHYICVSGLSIFKSSSYVLFYWISKLYRKCGIFSHLICICL